MKKQTLSKYDQESVSIYIRNIDPKKIIAKSFKEKNNFEPAIGIKFYTFKSIHFTGDFKGFIFKNCKFKDCTFENVFGFFLYFKKCIFSDCEFKNSRFSHGQFGWTELSFQNCKFINVEIDEGDLDNSLFNNCSFKSLKVAEDLFNVEFNSCYIQESYFSGIAYYSSLEETDKNTQDVTFSSCTILDTFFTNIDFRNSSFIDCSMFSSSFLSCILSNSSFNFGIKELEPSYSTMDFQTILKSNLTNRTLLKFIFNIHSLDYKEKIKEITSEYYCKKLFISYSFKDRLFASTLNEVLKKNGIKTFLWEKDAPGGQNLEDIMTKNITEHDIILFIASKHSLKSKACQFELTAGCKKQEETWNNVFFPIHIDSYIFEVQRNKIRPIEKADEYWKNIEELKRINSQDFAQFANLSLINKIEFEEAVLIKIVKEIQIMK
ncbi:TIR domain-containing protein [Sphingobacterium anhuiense]|uniref:TIR domain-containing protein n=1 Tax=Sphingobacterium anhuiense TaxID=493780 RepID=A0ABW5YV07_9SPHI